jgi:hypothetical protein
LEESRGGQMSKLLHDNQLCKKLLLTFNEIYHENRQADPRNYYSIFGWYSKSDKVSASRAMQNVLKPLLNRGMMNDRDRSIFKMSELNQGVLGKISTRLLKCFDQQPNRGLRL